MGHATRTASRSILVVAITLFAGGCSRTPSVSLGKRTLGAAVASQSGGRLSVTEFTKSNGIEREIAGQRMYVMEYLATIRFHTGAWKGGDAFTGRFSSFEIVDRQPGGWWEGIGKSWKYFERNAEVQLTGEIEFENTEAGWRPKGWTVTTSRVTSNRPDEKYYDQFVGFWASKASGAGGVEIAKRDGQYKMIQRQVNDYEIVLRPENQALQFLDLDMPVYLRIDAAAHQLHMGNETYDRVENSAEYTKALAAALHPAVPPDERLGDSVVAPQSDDAYKLKAVINDPDGFTNVRSGKSSSSSVVAIVRMGDEFSTYSQVGDWWQVKLASGHTGYMHVSRIKIKP